MTTIKHEDIWSVTKDLMLTEKKFWEEQLKTSTLTTTKENYMNWLTWCAASVSLWKDTPLKDEVEKWILKEILLPSSFMGKEHLQALCIVGPNDVAKTNGSEETKDSSDKSASTSIPVFSSKQ